MSHLTTVYYQVLKIAVFFFRMSKLHDLVGWLKDVKSLLWMGSGCTV